jgi:hypothetical protein
MHPDTGKYNKSLTPGDRKICELLAKEKSNGICRKRRIRYGTVIQCGLSTATPLSGTES